jgi:serine/alanine adding enzyme
MKIVQQLDESLWREFVEGHPLGNIFHTPEMFQVFSQVKGHHPTLWAVVNNDENILVLLLPVRITLLNGLFSHFTTRNVVYGSVLCLPRTESQEALAMLLRAYKCQVQASPLFTELRNLSDLSNIQPILQDNGFVYESHLNFLIDLQRPTKEIWHSLHSNVRTNVRKAHRMGVTVEEITSPDKILAAYAVLAKGYKRIRTPLAHPSLFETAFEILYPRRMIKFYKACLGNICIGIAIRLLYKDAIYAWYAGADRTYASYKANDLLNWHVLEWGSQNGFKYLDFGGAGKPNEDYGPRRFKAKFGGDLVNYGRNVCVHSPRLLKLSRWGYQFTRKFL